MNKAEHVPTLTPNALANLIFRIPDWQLLHSQYFTTFHINRLEETRPVMTFPMPPHRKTVIDFILVTQGRMIRRLGLNSYTIPANTFVFLPAYQISLDEWMSDDIKGFYCHFDASLLTKRWQKQDLEQEFPFLEFSGNPLVSIDNELLTYTLPLIYRLELEYKKNRTDSADLLRLYLLTLFTELKRSPKAADQANSEERTNNAALRFTQLYKNALSRHIFAKQTVSDYAELLHISPNHLNKCVKATTGQSAHELLDEMILLEAKVLLTQTDLSISEIAYKIGKQEPGNFARFFRLKTGLTPKEYRLMD